MVSLKFNSGWSVRVYWFSRAAAPLAAAGEFECVWLHCYRAELASGGFFLHTRHGLQRSAVFPHNSKQFGCRVGHKPASDDYSVCYVGECAVTHLVVFAAA